MNKTISALEQAQRVLSDFYANAKVRGCESAYAHFHEAALACTEALDAAAHQQQEPEPEAARQNGGLVRAALIDLMNIEKDALVGVELYVQLDMQARFARARAALNAIAQPPQPAQDAVDAVAVDRFIAFADKTSYLNHPDVPFLGTVNGDSEEAWRRRVVEAALRAALQPGAPKE